MGNIRCQACGRNYDYAKEGMCPRCGAYNRPPHRETVDLNGVVHHVRDQYDYESLKAAKGGKVCYEKKECHEEAARKIRTGGTKPAAGRIENFAARVASQSHGLPKKNKSIALLVVIIAAVIAAFVSSLEANRQMDWEPVAEPWESTVPVEEAPGITYGDVWAIFETASGALILTEWEWDGEILTVYYEAGFNPLYNMEETEATFEKIDGREYTTGIESANCSERPDGSTGCFRFCGEEASDTPTQVSFTYKGDVFCAELQ